MMGKENDKKESKIYGAVDCDHGDCNIFVFFSPELWIRKENILMIYIVGVLVITVTTTGYLYGMMASVCSVLLFNYFFTVPVHTFCDDGSE